MPCIDRWNNLVLITGAAVLGGLLATEATRPPGLDPWEIEARRDLLEAFQLFGDERACNQCTRLFGGASLPGQDLPPIRILRAELTGRLDPAAIDQIESPKGIMLYAWAEHDPPTIYLTRRVSMLSRRLYLALLFHEARGHLQLGLSDETMRTLLCPGAPQDDSHCITLAIAAGCPDLSWLPPSSDLPLAPLRKTENHP